VYLATKPVGSEGDLPKNIGLGRLSPSPSPNLGIIYLNKLILAVQVIFNKRPYTGINSPAKTGMEVVVLPLSPLQVKVIVPSAHTRIVLTGTITSVTVVDAVIVSQSPLGYVCGII
jgi:hypothetical protein